MMKKKSEPTNMYVMIDEHFLQNNYQCEEKDQSSIFKQLHVH